MEHRIKSDINLFFDIFDDKPRIDTSAMNIEELRNILQTLKLNATNMYAMSMFTRNTETMVKCKAFEAQCTAQQSHV